VHNPACYDLIVLAHAQALLADNHTTTVIEADVRRPEEVLDKPTVKEYLDFTEPIALRVLSILHHLRDDKGPAQAATKLRAPLATGRQRPLRRVHPDQRRPLRHAIPGHRRNHLRHLGMGHQGHTYVASGGRWARRSAV